MLHDKFKLRADLQNISSFETDLYYVLQKSVSHTMFGTTATAQAYPVATSYINPNPFTSNCLPVSSAIQEKKKKNQQKQNTSKTNNTEKEASKKSMESNNLNKEQDQNPWFLNAWTLLSKLRDQSPLIQCITNFVSMDLMANTLLSAGASPAMIHSIEEIQDFTPHIHALCINVGTLSPAWLPAMREAAQVANKAGKPWVLDPVAAGASCFRMKACLELVGLKPSVIRGNGSEIIALSKASIGATKGVDSSHESMDAMEAAKSLARSSGAIVAVSGAVDIITDGHRIVGAHNGVSMMQKITATGCAVTALIAAFVAVDPFHALEATASALSIFGIAGEMGMDMAKGPASLRMHLIDSLYNLDQAAVSSRLKVTSL